MWILIKPFAKKALEGAVGMAGGLALKKAHDALPADWHQRIADGLGLNFNPLNLTDPLGLNEEAAAQQAADQRKAIEDNAKAREAAARAEGARREQAAKDDAARREQAAQASGDQKAVVAAQQAKLEAEIAYQRKLDQLTRANEVKYKVAKSRGDMAQQALARANQQRVDVAKKLSEKEAELKLVQSKKADDGGDIAKLKALLELTQSIKGMTLVGADVPQFNAAQVQADLDMATSPRESDVDAFLRYEKASPEASELSGPFYPVTLVAVREV